MKTYSNHNAGGLDNRTSSSVRWATFWLKDGSGD